MDRIDGITSFTFPQNGGPFFFFFNNKGTDPWIRKGVATAVKNRCRLFISVWIRGSVRMEKKGKKG